MCGTGEFHFWIEENSNDLGVRWLLKRFGIYPNAYYNHLKHRKSDYHKHKTEVQGKITDIYHKHNGVDGYRTMTVYLKRCGYNISPSTVHKYMNIELGLKSIVRPKKPDYEHGNIYRYWILMRRMLR